MNRINETMLLRDAGIEPTEMVLKNALGDEMHNVYKTLIEIIISEFELTYEWRFYKDGNAWLCKVFLKKKTIFWLSVWANLIKISFYFTEKTGLGVQDLLIDDETKKRLNSTKLIGKLLPLSIDIKETDQLRDFREIVKYKLSL